VPKLWAIYLKACGLSARAFDALHALGIVMSHKWTANAFGTISDRTMEETRQLIHKLPWNITHDNVDFPLRVFSQRLDNQSHFISGCAATVWILPACAALSLQANRLFQVHRTLHCKEMFNFAEVLYGNETADARMEEQDAFFILRLLLDSPDFKEYSGQGALALDPPKPVHKLPTGPENSTIGHIMRTVPYEEASYDGTLRCMHEWLRQLHLATEDEQRRTALERIIAWLGDQLTVGRLRGLWKYRHEDYNSYDRMDWMIPVFGWFHPVMALANSLHKQYPSTSANIGGLRQAFDMLNRKGLISQATKGPFWHKLDEAKDHTKWQWTMRDTDVLPYLQLRDAIKAGDIGRMQDLLPVLLFQFAGKVPLFLIEVFQNAIVEFLLACWAVVNRFCIMLQIMIEFVIQNFKQVPRTHLGSKEHDPVKSAANAVGLPWKSHASAVQVRVGCHTVAVMASAPHFAPCDSLKPLDIVSC
jgi:hypothetical protein